MANRSGFKIDEFSFPSTATGAYSGTLSSTDITRYLAVGFDISPGAPSSGSLFITARTLQLIDKTRGLQLIDKSRSLQLV